MSEPEEPTLLDVMGGLKRIHARMDTHEELTDLVHKAISATEEVRAQNTQVLKYLRRVLPKLKRLETRVEQAEEWLGKHEQRLVALEKERSR